MTQPSPIIILPNHEDIAKQINTIMVNNLNHPSMHNREILLDIISDLQQYNNSLPTIKEYVKGNLL